MHKYLTAASWRRSRMAPSGFWHLNPWGRKGQICTIFLLSDDTFALMPWLLKPYSRRQLTREERIANYRISRGRKVVENAFGILANRFRVLLGTMEQRPKVVRDIVLTCVVLTNMLRTHQGGLDRAPNPADDIVAISNEAVVYMPDETTGTLPRRQSFSETYWKNLSFTLMHWLGRRTGSEMWRGNILRIEEAGIYQFFSGLPNYSKNFYKS